MWVEECLDGALSRLTEEVLKPRNGLLAALTGNIARDSDARESVDLSLLARFGGGCLGPTRLPLGFGRSARRGRHRDHISNRRVAAARGFGVAIVFIVVS